MNNFALRFLRIGSALYIILGISGILLSFLDMETGGYFFSVAILLVRFLAIPKEVLDLFITNNSSDGWFYALCVTALVLGALAFWSASQLKNKIGKSIWGLILVLSLIFMVLNWLDGELNKAIISTIWFAGYLISFRLLSKN